MRVGFVTLFAWRPHVEHMHYLAQLSRQSGQDVRFLVCDADLPNCYTRELHRESPSWLECMKCRAGGLRSYETESVTSLGSCSSGGELDLGRFGSLAESSASTLCRFESNVDYSRPEFRATTERLAPAVARAYDATRRWIDKERLDALILFNGRMDATRGVFEAARDAGIRAVSMERTWFGDGIQLLPDETCLGLRSIDRLMAQWRGTPLSLLQSQRASRLIASRFLRRNAAEWRAYNVDATVQAWPASGGHRLLLIPGSRNEIRGFAEREGTWEERTRAFDLVIQKLRLQPADVVLRCHPNWAENIGTVTGEPSERYYTDWAKRRGIHVIGSRDRASTSALIAESEAVVLNGGSAALEAGALGKQVIATTPSIYQAAGFQTRAYDESDIAALQFDARRPVDARGQRSEEIRRLTVRFLHTMVYRVAQFVPHVKLLTTTRYTYYEGADPNRLTALLSTGLLDADDSAAANDTAGEDVTLDRMAQGDWERLHAFEERPEDPRIKLTRRLPFRTVDKVRDWFPRGDR